MVSGVVVAQEEDSGGPGKTRGGLSIGAGYAKASTSKDRGVFSETTSTPNDFSTGMAMGIDLEYLAGRNVYLEFMMSLWLGTIEGDLGGEEWDIGVIAGGVRWYPTGDGFYVRGGFGPGIITATLQNPPRGVQSEFNDYGLGLLGGIGYDITISEKVMTGPALDVAFVDVGDDVRALGIHLLVTLRLR